jgi:hypothetical protein
VTSTVHPSAILRNPDEEGPRVEYKSFVADLTKASAGGRALIPAHLPAWDRAVR